MRCFRVVVASVVLAVAFAGCGRESQHDIRVSIEQIASVGSEGALMADDLSRGRTKTTYVRVHGEELSSQLEHEAEKLNDAPYDPALKTRVEKAIELAGDIGGGIDDMRVSPHDRGLARDTENKLQQWAAEASKLAEGL